MRKRYAATMIGATTIGLCLGVLMIGPWLVPGDLPKALSRVHEVANTPALWFSHIWTYHLNLPPRGEVAWVAVPIVAILLQWTLLGFAIGYWRYRALRKSKQN